MIGRILLVLCLITGTGAVNAADAPENGSQPPNAPQVFADDDEDRDDVATDGSEALIEAAEAIFPADLMPVGPAEEEALLGVWGDSLGEDED